MAKTKLNKKDDAINEENFLNELVNNTNDNEIVKGEFEDIKKDEEDSNTLKGCENDKESSDISENNKQSLEGVFNPSSLKDVKEDKEQSADVVFNPSSLKENKEQSDKIKENKVRVKLNKDHKCCIGGERYNFKKDGVYFVNANIKRILNKSGLLKPLS